MAALPEVAALPWRERASPAQLERWGRLWTLFTVAHVVPFVAAAALLIWMEPLSAPVALAALAHAWIIPELYAFRGSNVLKPKGARHEGAEPLARGLLGDLLGHQARELQRATGLALERGAFGSWLVGEAGAALITSGGRRMHCFCVRVEDPDLPPSDRIAHLLLALRSDEAGFATVANHAFSGAPWRVRRRLPERLRPALSAAVAQGRGRPAPGPRAAAAT